MENKTKKAKWTKKFKALIISLSLAFAVALGGACAAIGLTVGNNKRFGGSLADGVTDNTPAIPDPAEIFYAGATVGEVTYATNADAWAAAINYSIENSAVVQFDLKTNWTATADANGFGTATETNSPFGAAGSLSVPAGASVILNISKNVALNRNLASVDAIANGEVLYNRGVLYVTGEGTITGGNSTFIGGGIRCSSDSELTINSGFISGNTANEGGGLYVPGKLLINGGTITNNTAKTAGGGVVIYITKDATIAGGTITKNTATTHGGGIYAFQCGLNITGGTISGNTATGNGGGISVEAATLTITGGTISNNTASEGGGIYEAGAAIVTINDGVISNNILTSTDQRGGAIHVASATLYLKGGFITGHNNSRGAIYAGDSNVEMSGGEISNNNISLGGAYYLTSNAKLVISETAKIVNNTSGNGAVYGQYYSQIEMNGGEISHNKITSNGTVMLDGADMIMNGGKIANNTVGVDGGGVLVWNWGTGSTMVPSSFTMHGGEITDNTAGGNGGGISTRKGSPVTITGGTISGNTAANGGGIYTNAPGELNEDDNTIKTYGLTINGGTISGNTASAMGGGIFGDESSTIKIGAVTISNNTAKIAGGGICTSGLNSRKYSAGVKWVTLDIDGATISDNTTGDGGGVWTYFTTLNIDNSQITNNTATVTGGGGVCHGEGTATITGTTISGNKATTGMGGAIYSFYNWNDDTDTAATRPIYGRTTFVITSSIISDNYSAGNGGGFNGGGEAKITVSGGEIKNNTAVGNGGGIYSTGSGKLNMYGTIEDAGLTITGNAKITGNRCGINGSSHDGGGIYNNGTLKMDSGIISGNSATDDGGGIYAYGTFEMTGGTITGNDTNFGGGVLLSGNSSKFLMSGGTISNNTAYVMGGGVHVNGSTFEMTGGTITGNTADVNGGGVYVTGYTTLIGVTITGNTAIDGGGIYMGTNSAHTLSLRNVKITGNTAWNNGGGVYYHLGRITFNDEIIIKNNTASGFTDNFYRANSTEACIAQTLSASSEIWISAMMTTPVIQIPSQARLSCVKLDNPDHWKREDRSRTTPAGSYDVYLEGNADSPEDIWRLGVNASYSSSTRKLVTLSADMSATNGSFGTDSVAYKDGSLYVPDGADIVLDLLETTVDMGNVAKPVIIVDGKLTIKGSNVGEIIGGYAGGIVVNRGGELVLNGGNIRKNSAKNGGGVYVCEGGTFIMNGGYVETNTAENGGGVYVEKGATFTMNTGYIQKNTSTGILQDADSVLITGGAGVYNLGTFVMNGGYIDSNNSGAGHGAGVFTYDTGTFEMHGGRITNNKASNGAGVEAYKSTFEMTGGMISGNTAPGAGGGVYINGGNGNRAVKFILTGGFIMNNTSTDSRGGGILLSNTAMNLGAKTGEGANAVYSGDATIKGNESKIDNNMTGGGGIMVDVDAVLNFYSGTVRDNKAIRGGGIYTVGTLNMEGGNLFSNSATKFGAGIYTRGPSTSITGGNIYSNAAQTATTTDGTTTYTVTGDGGGIMFSGGNSLTIGGTAKIYNNTALYGGGINVGASVGTLTISGGEISNNTATVAGGGIYLGGTSKLVMTGGKISGNQTTGTDTTKNFGGGVFVSASATFTMSGTAVISGNTSVAHGGGIYSYGDVDIQGGEISGNTGFTGGICATKTLNISGGKISGNKATKNGGGVAFSDGTFTMSDGEIFDNTAPIGGGVYIHSGTFKMTGGSIYSNEATLMADSATTGYAGGGGVYTIGSFEMSGGEIYDNYAVQGGGILSTAWASVSGTGITAAPASKIPVTISGGRIYNNSSKLSGGAIFAAGTKLTLSGNGVIAENKSVEGNVGGVACIRYTDFTISGGEISGNSAAQNSGGVYSSTESSITMTGGTISGNTAVHGGGVYITDNTTFTMDGGEISGNTASKSGTYSAGGGVYVVGTFNLFGGTISGNKASAGGGISVSGSSSVLNIGTEANASTAVISGNNADHGGGIYTSNVVGSIVNMYGGTITENASVSNSYGGGGILVNNGVTFNMYSGVISNNDAANVGGGVYSGGTFNLSGGTISGNTASGNGAIYVLGTFTMNGGTISGNDVLNGSVFVTDGGSFDMKKGTISENVATQGGGVYVYGGGSMTMSGGVITNNETTVNSAGVYVATGATFEMTGGTISENTSAINGGGVRVYDNGTFTISGGTISGNTAINGGGICLSNSSIFNVSGSPVISDNYDNNGNLNNVYLASGRVITVTGALANTSRIGLTAEAAVPVTITSGYGANMGSNAESLARNIFSADVEGVVAVYESNEIVLTQGVVLTVNNDKGEKIGSISTVSRSTVNGAFDEDKRIYTLTENGALANTSGFAFASDVVPEGYAAYMYVYGDVNKAEITSYTMGTENATVCLTTKALEKNYTINYYVQGNNGEYGTTPITATHSAATDSAVVVLDENGRPFATSITPADQYELDEAYSEWKSATVKGDGSTVVDVYLKLKEYTVSFTAPGATNGMQKKTFKYGAVISDEGLKVPSKDMNTFAGWYYDAACTEANKVNFGVDKVEGDITLYAKFTTKSYSLIFDLNLGDGEKQLNTSLVLSQDAADLAGNKVLWDTDSLFDASFKFGQTEGTGRYQISYDVNNVSSPKNLLGIRPSAIGYTFLGWFASETATGQTQTIRKPSANTADVITLTARWEPATYTMRFDKRNGSRIEIKEPANLAFWKDVLPTAPENAGYEFAGWYTTEAAAKDPEHNLDVFMSSSIYEEGNEEATAKFSIYDFGALYGDSASGYNFNNLTIYAGWKSVDVRIRVADSEETPMMGDLEFKTSAGSTISTTTAVHIGDEITVEAYADPGYRFISLTVGGRTSTGKIEEVRDENDPEKIKYWTTKFTVSGRDLIDDGRLYVEVGAVFTERRYTITYDTAGGRSTDSTFARTYSASELDENSLNRAKLPSLLTKRGYDFAGWVFSTNEDEVAYDTQDDITSSLYGAELWLKRPYDYAESGYRNITLKAVWKAQVSYVYLYNASYSAGYNYDEAGKRYIIRQYGADFEEPKDLTTDMEIEIVNPSRGESFVFLGWATSRNGVVVYPAVEGKDTITYTVNADKDENGNLLNRNNLYAVWHIAGVNYIIMSADNNGATYGDGEGITMSAQTARKYDATEAANITLNYTWYKIYDGQYDNCFDVKEYEDAQGYKIYVDDTDAIVAYEKDGKYYGADKQTEISKEQAEAYGSKLTYKEFNATKALAGGYCEVKKFIDPDTNREVVTTGLKPTDVLKVNVREVNDCGIYICVVEVVATGEGATSKTDGYGEIEITMNKAVYDGVDMTDTTVSYNTAPRYDMISIKDNSGNDPTTEDGGVRYLVLPDGSRLIVTYRYFVGEGEARKEITDLTQIKNVGTYHVEVSFEFTPDGDKGNYELPTTIDADLIVEPDSIGNMQYEFKHDGTLVTTDTSKFSGGYDGKEYKVEATILDTTGIGTDAPLVTTIDDIAFDVKVYRVSETGSETEVTGPTTEAGSYYVQIVGLKGEAAKNYALGSGLTLRADYSIGKKTYEVAGHIKFDDDEVTFDNEIHTLNVKLDDGFTMPEDVNVVYKTSYVAEAEDFTVGRLPNEAKDFNGGRYAGEYTVTVTFEFKNDEAKNNYEALESMSATLKIKKANIFDFYNKGGKDLLRDGGFVNATYAYTVGKYYDPYIANGMFTETEHFEVEYEYYRVNENAEAGAGREMLASGTHAELAAQSKENALISLAGKYEIVARIKYVSALYRNNFEEITESESTITYVIRAVAVEKVEVIEWADGFDRVVKLGAGFDFGEGENYGWIKKILVTYAQDEQGQGGGTLEVKSPADIRLAGIKFEQKNNVDQTTFWKVGAFNVIVSFYGTESEAYVFTVKEKVASVELQYSTDDGATFRPIGENGVELVDGANYSFRIEYKCTNEQGVANTTKTSALTYDGALKLGSNKLTVSEAYYEFDEITVDMYKVIEGDVTWQYSTDGEHWDNIADGKLEYAGVEYKIRATFEDGGETQALEAHTALGVAVLNYTSGGYLMQVGRSGNYLVKAEYLLEITPLVLEVSWDKNELPYNTWHQSPVATAKNMKDKDIELITFDYEFEQGGATVTSANVVNVGDYVVKLVLRGDETARNNYTLIGSETAEHEFSIVQAEIEMTVTYSEHNYGPNKTYAGNPQGLRLNALKKDFGENAEVEGEFAFITNYSAATGKYDIIDGADLKDKISSVGYADIMYVYIPENKNYKDKIGTIEINVLGQTARSGAGALSVEFGEDAVQFYLVNQQFDTYGIEVYLLYQSAYEEDGEWYGMRDRIENPNFRIGSMVAQGYTITAQDLSSEKVVLRAISGSNSGTLDVKVVDKVAQGLEVSSTGHRTEYYAGETFDFSDMEFRVTFGPDDNPQDGLKKGSIKADFSGAFTEVGTKTVTFTYFNVSCTETFTVKAKEDLQIIQPTNLVLTYKNGEALEAPQLRFSVDGMTFGQTELDGVTVRVEVRDKATNEIAVLGAKKEGLYTVRYIFTVTNPRFNTPRTINLEVRVTENPYQVDIDTASVDGQKVAYTGEYIAIPKAVVGSVTDTTTDTTVPSNYVIIEYTINGERVTSESQWTRTALNRGAYEVIVTVKVRRNGEADYTAATASYTFEVTQAVNDKGNASIEVHPVILGEGADFNFTVTADFGADTATFEYSRTGNANDWTSEVPTEAGTWFVRAKIAETENYQGIDEIIASFEVRIADKQADTSEEGSVEGSVSGSDGIGADWKLTIKESGIEDVNINKQTSLYGYTVSLVDKNGVAVETTGEYKVSIKLTAEQVEALSGRTDVRLFLYGADGKATPIKNGEDDVIKVKDGYIEFTTESFGRFVITSVIPDAPTVPVGLLVAVIIGAVAAAGMIAAVVVVAVKKRKGAQE